MGTPVPERDSASQLKLYTDMLTPATTSGTKKLEGTQYWSKVISNLTKQLSNNLVRIKHFALTLLKGSPERVTNQFVMDKLLNSVRNLRKDLKDLKKANSISVATIRRTYEDIEKMQTALDVIEGSISSKKDLLKFQKIDDSFRFFVDNFKRTLSVELAEYKEFMEGRHSTQEPLEESIILKRKVVKLEYQVPVITSEPPLDEPVPTSIPKVEEQPPTSAGVETVVSNISEKPPEQSEQDTQTEVRATTPELQESQTEVRDIMSTFQGSIPEHIYATHASPEEGRKFKQEFVTQAKKTVAFINEKIRPQVEVNTGANVRALNSFEKLVDELDASSNLLGIATQMELELHAINESVFPWIELEKADQNEWERLDRRMGMLLAEERLLLAAAHATEPSPELQVEKTLEKPTEQSEQGQTIEEGGSAVDTGVQPPAVEEDIQAVQAQKIEKTQESPVEEVSLKSKKGFDKKGLFMMVMLVLGTISGGLMAKDIAPMSGLGHKLAVLRPEENLSGIATKVNGLSFQSLFTQPNFVQESPQWNEVFEKMDQATRMLDKSKIDIQNDKNMEDPIRYNAADLRISMIERIEGERRQLQEVHDRIIELKREIEKASPKEREKLMMEFHDADARLDELLKSFGGRFG